MLATSIFGATTGAGGCAGTDDPDTVGANDGGSVNNIPTTVRPMRFCRVSPA